MKTSKNQSQKKLIAISIVSFDSPKSELLNTITSAVRALMSLHDLYPSSSSIVSLVDNSEQKRISLDMFSSLQSHLRECACEFQLLQGHGNIGYGSGQNLAFDSQIAYYHLFINPDVELASDCLIQGIRYLESNKDVAIVSPNATDAHGKKQFLCKRYPTLLDFFIRGFVPKPVKIFFADRMARYEMQELSETEATKSIPIVSGCFMLCRSAVIGQISGFDPRFFLYFEDFDLSLRAGKVASLAYLPSMRITHSGGNASKKGIEHIGFFIRSCWLFCSIYEWRWFRSN